MAKKLSFNDLPSAIEKILEILSSDGTEFTAMPELIRRISLLEKKIEYLQLIASPDKPVMDMQTVCRVLKLRPKAVKELADSGALPYRSEGRKVLFYEDGVVRFFMTQPSWSSAVSKSATVRPVPIDTVSDGRRRVDISAASEILSRSTGAIYQQVHTNSIPYHKDGKKIYFYTDELQEWAKMHSPRKRRQKTKMP